MPRQKQNREYAELYRRMTPIERLELLWFELLLSLRRQLSSVFISAPGANPLRITALHTLSLTAVLVVWPPSDALSIVQLWIISVLATYTLNELLPGH